MPGMYYSYKSDYPNQVHQLNFSISQNHYVLKSGEIKYQQKKFDVNWQDYEKSGKRHLVNFLIRDHYSNCFYAEIHPIDELPDLSAFLFNAWRPKERYEFCGIPKVLIAGQHILDRFPGLLQFEKNTRLQLQKAQNGFATGIRSLRDWEHNIRFYSLYQDCNTIKGFQENVEFICRDLNLRKTGKTEENLLKWLNGEPQCSVIDDWDTFRKYFNERF